MIPELGNFALILALSLALLQASVPLVGVAKNRSAWMAAGRQFAYGQCLFVWIAYIALTYSFVSHDFSVQYVANNSSLELPFWYQFSAVWGSHEGSVLLWSSILSVWTVLVARFSSNLPEAVIARILAILAMISCGFLCFILATSNPFLRFLPNLPSNGADLNPLLQDIGFLIHPPMLYMGYVGFAVPFAFAITALLSRQMDTHWVRWVRPWTLAAWSFLTLGITLGSWWAYRELGWGGWWFWDPVENASFLPWLVGTALIHSLAVTEKRNAFKAWTILLAITAFSLSLLGTFLVRSGILTSVHAFAVDPKRGVFMLMFLLLVIGGSLLVYAWRAVAIKSGEGFQLLSRETFLLMNNLLLMVAMITVLLGTLYPLLIQALGLGKLSVGAPYFNTVFVPLIAPLIFLMGIGPHCLWQSMQPTHLFKRLRYVFFLSLTLGIILPWLFTDEVQGYVVLGLSLALWIFLTTLQDLLRRIRAGRISQLTRSQCAMLIAHLGVAVCVVGITLSCAYSIERNVRMAPGDEIILGPYQFEFQRTKAIKGPNYTGVAALFKVTENGKSVSTLQAEKKFYTVKRMTMTDAAIDASVFRDLYIALGAPIDKNSWAVRLYYKPFVRWIWFGGLLMLLGGLLAMRRRK